MTELPEGFIRFTACGSVVAVDAIAAVYVDGNSDGDVVVVEMRSDGSRFVAKAPNFEEASLLRDEIVRDMWKAKRSAS